MKRTFTTSEIISHLYNETDVKTSYLINEMLSNDWKKLGLYNEYKKAKDQLDEISFSPSQKCISNILFEAKA